MLKKTFMVTYASFLAFSINAVEPGNLPQAPSQEQQDPPLEVLDVSLQDLEFLQQFMTVEEVSRIFNQDEEIM